MKTGRIRRRSILQKTGRAILLCALFFVGTGDNGYSSPQPGTPLLTHYHPPEKYASSINAVVQDAYGNIYLANPQGLLRFDGISWELLPDIHNVFSLYRDTLRNRIWIGGSGYAGYLQTENGETSSLRLVTRDKTRYGDFDQIFASGDTLFFCSTQAVLSIFPDGYDSLILQSGDQAYNGYFLHQHRLYVNIEDKGLSFYSHRKLTPVADGERFDKDIILFSVAIDREHTLFGTDNSFLYLFDGKNFTDYIPKDEEYIFNRILTHGVLVNDSTLALGTRNGGCLILDTKSRSTQYILNYQSGLPDNEVLSLGTFYGNSLIIGHSYGFSVIDLSLPVYSYNIYPGLEGNILSLFPMKKNILVGTSEGIYFQKQVRESEKTQIMVRIPVHIRDTIVTHTPGEVIDIPENNENSENTQPANSGPQKKSIFSRLFGKKKKTDTIPVPTQKEPASTRESNISVVKKTIYKYVPKEITKYKSVGYEYEKAGKLNASCSQFLPYGDEILVASNAGVYSYRDEKASFIFLGTKVYNIYPNPKDQHQLFCGTENGVYTINHTSSGWEVNRMFFQTDNPIYSIIRDADTLWLGSTSMVYQVPLKQYVPDMTAATEYHFPTSYPQEVTAFLYNRNPAFVMKQGWYDYMAASKRMILRSSFKGTGLSDLKVITDQGNIWIKGDNNWNFTGAVNGGTLQAVPYLNIFDRITNIHTDPAGNLWVIVDNNQIYKILGRTGIIPDFHVHATKVIFQRGTETSNLLYRLLKPSGEIRITLSAPWYLQPSRTEYQYRVEGFGNTWSDWKTGKEITLSYLPPGDYLVHYRARNVLNIMAEGTPVPIHIPVPFWQRWWFIVAVLLFVGILVWLIIRLRLRKLENDRKILEAKVRQRTTEIRKQKEKIEVQRDEILQQKKAITDSINYAQRIQKALLPPEKMIERVLPEHFILFLPRDIVSGDFYWIKRRKDQVIIAAVDCTGHGVPGAFMSMLGSSFLNEIITREKGITAAEILNELRNKVKSSLHQTGDLYENKDGMDMALCILNLKEHTLQYAGAYNPLYLVRNKELIIYAADKMPIGIHFKEDTPFTTKTISLEEGDMIYLFSDGYIDQFGEKEKKKFKFSRFNELLISIADEKAERQKELLIENFNQWKGNYEQIDDILVMGIRYRKNER